MGYGLNMPGWVMGQEGQILKAYQVRNGLNMSGWVQLSH